MLLAVVQAEYLRRVTTKAFLLTTVLAPVAIVVLVGAAVVGVSSSVDAESTRERNIAILDESGLLLPKLLERDSEVYRMFAAPSSLAAAKQVVIDGDAEILLVLPKGLVAAGGPTEATAYVDRQQGIEASASLRRFVQAVVREVQLAAYDLPPEVLDALGRGLSLDTVSLDDDGEQRSTMAAMVVGFAAALLMLMIMAVYGGLVMQAVMEEKANRMAEILVSTVRPFELLMGKILAVAGVAATQFVVWLAMLAVAGVVGMQIIPTEDLVELGVAEAVGDDIVESAIPGFRFDVLLVVVVMLPLGYLIYASVFGALAAMYETSQEAQVAVTIAMAPLIAVVMLVQVVGLAPNSALVTAGALFPFTAPAMLPTSMLVADLPPWQVVLSIVLCALSALAVVWVAGRIFRGSILTYGKKIGIKDIWLILTSD